MNLAEALEQSKDRSSAKRRTAARWVRMNPDPAACSSLQAALEVELADKRTWETQYQMIMALSACNCKHALPLIESILSRALEPMVHLAAGDAVVRITNGDSNTLLRLLENANLFAVEGALRAAALLRIRPSPAVVRKLIAFARKTDSEGIRFWMAAAGAGWNGEEVERFLRECLGSTSTETRKAASASLDHRYLKWRPL